MPIPVTVSALTGRVCRSTNVAMIFDSSKEIKLLMNELDEEKRIRLTLQVRKERKCTIYYHIYI